MRSRAVLLAFLVVALAAGAFAQGVQTATATGAVTGPDGAALPGVTVTASSPAQLGEKTAVTDANGAYIIRGLTPGSYKITFTLEGMSTIERKIDLPLGQTTRVDAALQMATATETIVVTGETPTALETSTVGANITKEQVDTLPLVRTPTGIASLSGAVSDRNTPVGGQLTINGGMAYDNSFLVNGVNVQDPIFGSTNNLFIEDSILETQVLTSGISAEYGSFTGGVVNVITKSGGNDFSGSLRADFTRPSWRDETPYERGFRGDGVTPATPTPRGAASNKLGKVLTGTLGGPFVRDRLWFFAAVRDETNTNPVTLPLDAPLSNEIKNRRTEGKLTGNITASHSLQVSYINNPDERKFEVQVAPLTIDAVGVNSKRENDGKVVTYNGVLTNSLFAEARYSQKHFGFRGLGGTLTDIVDSPMRAFTFQGVPTAGTFNAPYFDATDPEDRDNKILYGSLSYFLGTKGFGNHDIKGGVEQFTVTRTGGNSQTATDYVFYTPYLLDDGGAPVYDAAGHLVPNFVPGLTGLGHWVATRGSQQDTETTSYFLNDRWDLNSHWSFNLGIRHEVTKADATGNITSIDTTNTVPRLGASFDPQGNGKYKFDVTYSEYAGRYNPAITAANTPVGNPALLYGLYTGPAGSGRDFAPGFDPSNYFFYYASVPLANTFVADGMHSPIQKELTISGGLQLSKGGYAKLTYIDRSLKEVIEDFITIDQGCSEVIDGGIDYGCFDNVVYDNSSVPKRDYQALELQGRYSLRRNWSVEGNYTYQLKYNGNYEGEGGQGFGATPIGNYPEISTARAFPVGHLSQYEKNKIRLWTNYNMDLGRYGTMTGALLWRYDSAQTFSFSQGSVPYTAIQRARDPGYSSPPANFTLFFGDRGIGTFDDSSVFDLSLTYGIPVFKRVEPWIKFDVRNMFNDQTLLTWNTAVSRVTTGPLDSDGLPLTFTKNATFGRPASAASYQVPREYFVSAGIRF